MEARGETSGALGEGRAAVRACLVSSSLPNPPQPSRRRIRTAWFQYLITLAAYCFDWWERLIVHALVLGGGVLGFYGLLLVGRAAGAAFRAVRVALTAADAAG